MLDIFVGYPVSALCTLLGALDLQRRGPFGGVALALSAPITNAAVLAIFTTVLAPTVRMHDILVSSISTYLPVIVLTALTAGIALLSRRSTRTEEFVAL
ncbi:MAG TPA: hypothetical protein VHD90_01635 [Phototrophicaceae bacterium]|nr:hypothetical protein [Phototrophicaceae bacterium]